MEATRSVTDQERLEGLRKGDHSAFEAIFREFYAALVGLAERMLRDGGAAEEVVQDVFVELWRRRERLEVEESLRAYLYRATRNRALNRIRHEEVVRRSASAVRDETIPPPPASVAAAEREIDEAVAEALDSLPPRCREVFELSRGHGLRYSEIADALGISVKTVEAQMGKALRLLRKRLRAWVEGDG